MNHSMGQRLITLQCSLVLLRYFTFVANCFIIFSFCLNQIATAHSNHIISYYWAVFAKFQPFTERALKFFCVFFSSSSHLHRFGHLILAFCTNEMGNGHYESKPNE